MSLFKTCLTHTVSTCFKKCLKSFLIVRNLCRCRQTYLQSYCLLASKRDIFNVVRIVIEFLFIYFFFPFVKYFIQLVKPGRTEDPASRRYSSVSRGPLPVRTQSGSQKLHRAVQQSLTCNCYLTDRVCNICLSR